MLDPIGAPRPWRTGQRLRDRFELTQRLGRGGEADTWLAYDHATDRYVALKIREHRDILAPVAATHEVEMLASIPPHVGLPVFFDDFASEDCGAIVMAWIDGIDLAEHLRRLPGGAMTPGDALRCLEQVASTLDHLHRQTDAVVHGDLKPANVMIRADGTCVVIDFGIATYVGGRQPQGLGTPGYRAPEAVAGDPLTPAADVYGLGVLAFTLLTGEVDPGTADWHRAIGVPIGDVVRAALATDPSRRPRSAGAFVDALRAAVDGLLTVTTDAFGTARTIDEICPNAAGRGRRRRCRRRSSR